MGGRVLPQTGGFTDKVGLVDRTIVVTGIPFGADEKLGYVTVEDLRLAAPNPKP